MKITAISAAVAGLTLVAISGAANAALTPLYSTNFNAPTYTDGALLGQDGWLITGTSTVNPINVANTATNGNVTLAATGQDANRPFGVGVTATPVTASSVLLGATVSVASSNTAGDYFLHLSDGGTSNFNGRIYAKADNTTTPTGFYLGVASSNTNITYGTTLLSFGTAYNILERLDLVTGLANDVATLYVNPTTADGSGDTSYVSSTGGGTDAVLISAVNLRQGTAGPLATVDNIAVSYVAAVPEPTTLAALAGLGALAFGRRRRA